MYVFVICTYAFGQDLNQGITKAKKALMLIIMKQAELSTSKAGMPKNALGKALTAKIDVHAVVG
jgi:hypothetical protein